MSIYGMSCDSFKHIKEETLLIQPEDKLYITENQKLKELNRELVSRLERAELEIEFLGGINPNKIKAKTLLLKSELKAPEEVKVNQEELKMKNDLDQANKQIETLKVTHEQELRDAKEELAENIEQLQAILSRSMNSGIMEKIKKMVEEHELDVKHLNHKIKTINHEKNEIEEKYKRMMSLVGVKDEVFTNLK